jgi:hypothetical protein
VTSPPIKWYDHLGKVDSERSEGSSVLRYTYIFYFILSEESAGVSVSEWRLARNRRHLSCSFYFSSLLTGIRSIIMRIIHNILLG